MPPVQFAINSYQSRALPLSAQQLVNFYAEQAPRDAKSEVALYGTPGLKIFCDNVGDGPIRGMELMRGVLYVLSGNVLFGVTKDCVITDLGSIGLVPAVTLDIEESGASEGWQLSEGTCPPGAVFNTGLENSVVFGLTFNPDGTKMYLSDAHTDSAKRQIQTYSLSIAFDLTTVSYDGIGSELDMSTFGRINGIRFGRNGERFYVAEDEGGDGIINQFNLSVAYDISTAVFTSSKRFANNQQLTFTLHPDGTFLYLGQRFGGAQRVEQYAFPAPWEVGGIAAASPVHIKSLFGQVGTLQSIFFKSDGLRIYILDEGGTTVKQFDLTVAFDISTMTNPGILFDIQPSCGGSPREIFWKEDGSILFITNINDHLANRVYSIAFPILADSESGGFVESTTVQSVAQDDVPLKSPDCVSMSHNDATIAQLIIVDGTNGWIYDVVNGLQQITDEDFFPADVVDFQDNYFILNRAGTGQFFLSALNDGLTYSGTDFATAEGDPDTLVSLISNRRELWLFGAETIEIFFNSGDADFPFVRYEGGFLERGCLAAFSVAEDDNSLFWLGEDRIFYRADGYELVRISQHGIEEALRKYKVLHDACAFIYTMAGHKFYVCTFPSEDATWVFDITTGMWHERRSRGMGRWRVNTYADAFGKHLVGDFEDGRIGEMDLDTFEEYGVTMTGLAAGPVAHLDRKRIAHRRFELDVESGVGLTKGQGSDPRVWLDWSDDGGRSFSVRKPFRSLGKIGEYQKRLRWNRMGSSRERIYRVTVSDPVKRSIVGTHLEARAGRQ